MEILLKNPQVDPELEIKRLQNIEQARLRQEAALNAAKEKYLEEKRLVSELIRINKHPFLTICFAPKQT